MGRLTVNSGVVWHSNHQGLGSGLDADLLDGQAGSTYLPSDRRLKREIASIEPKLRLCDLQELLKQYRYNSDPIDKQRYGVIAQDLQAFESLEGTVYDTADRLSIDANSVLFMMINSLVSEVVELKERLAQTEKP